MAGVGRKGAKVFKMRCNGFNFAGSQMKKLYKVSRLRPLSPLKMEMPVF
jgi:hypothetical protein